MDCTAEKPSMWSIPLDEMLNRVADDLQVLEIRTPEHLSRAQQTGFVWTTQPGTVCLAMNRRYVKQALDNDQVCAIIATPEAMARDSALGKTVILSAKADELYHYLHAEQTAPLVTQPSVLPTTARIDESAILRGDVIVEDDVVIGPHVTISGPARIGRGTQIEAGAIIGCDGLYAKVVRGRKLHLPHFGGVDIGEYTHIHAGAVLVRSAIRGESTLIGDRVHIGVMTNIGHDAQIDADATLSSNCVIAGRARIGKRAWIGASVSVSNMIRVGDDAHVHIGAVVVRDVPADAKVSGNFAVPHAKTVTRLMRDLRNES